LSDASGSFKSFINIGHETALNGSIPVVLGNSGDHYVVRIISTDPYSLSNLSAELQVFNYPSPQLVAQAKVTQFGYIAFSGDAIQLTDGSSESPGSTYSWTFGQDANILTSTNPSPTVTYATVGIKSGTLSVSNPSGCMKSAPFQITILSCHPVIPDTAHVVTGTESGSFQSVWVKAGGNYTVNRSFGPPTIPVIYAESGSSITVNNITRGFYYLKKDASIIRPSIMYAVIILNSGNVLDQIDNQEIDTIYCDDLQFDYSKVGGPSDVHTTENPLQIFNSPNNLRVRCEGKIISVSIVNLLGSTILSETGQDALSLDFSRFTDGVYFAVITSGDHRELLKIAIMH
ncbi:MAG: T9SS type A sorting domain-containing protein, partial [Candidatus Kapaibacterium sp.]